MTVWNHFDHIYSIEMTSVMFEKEKIDKIDNYNHKIKLTFFTKPLHCINHMCLVNIFQLHDQIDIKISKRKRLNSEPETSIARTLWTICFSASPSSGGDRYYIDRDSVRMCICDGCRTKLRKVAYDQHLFGLLLESQTETATKHFKVLWNRHDIMVYVRINSPISF